jgi:hypothetical protein
VTFIHTASIRKIFTRQPANDSAAEKSGDFINGSLPRKRFLRFAAVISPTASQSGNYLSTPVIVTLDGQWQVRITIRSDAFDEPP